MVAWGGQDCGQTAEESEKSGKGVHGEAGTGAGAALTTRSTISPFILISLLTSHLQTLQLGKAATTQRL